MNSQLQYKLLGLAYWFECLNPLRNTIAIKHLPLDLELLAYKRDGVGRGLYRRKTYEPGLTKLLIDRYENNGVHNFIDVGANIGYFSCLMAKLAGSAGMVLAIEPEPQNLDLLRRNVKINGSTNVGIHACAAGATAGTAQLGLYKPSNRGRHSIAGVNSGSTIEVPVKTLDELAGKAATAITTWSLVKIDVEGYEANVLEGAEQTLARTQTLVIEYSPQFLSKAGVDPASLFDKLRKNFSKIHRIEGTQLVPVTAVDCVENQNQVDLVFDR